MTFVDAEHKPIKHISARKFRRLKKMLKLLMEEVPINTRVCVQLNYFQIDDLGVQLLADIYYTTMKGKSWLHETVQTFSG